MKHPKVKVEERKVFGKKLKNLRKEGILPGNLYGKDIKSQAIQIPYKEFEKIFKEVGTTGLVDIEVNGKTVPALIHNLQTDYRRTPLHADFFKVNLKEKIKTMIPLSFVGEPVAVAEKQGLLMENIHEVEVEALPDDLPEKIEVNVEGLSQVGDQITAGDLKAPSGVQILTDPNQTVAKIGELVSKATEEEIAEEEAAAEEAKEEAEGEQEEQEEATPETKEETRQEETRQEETKEE